MSWTYNNNLANKYAFSHEAMPYDDPDDYEFKQIFEVIKIIEMTKRNIVFLVKNPGLNEAFSQMYADEKFIRISARYNGWYDYCKNNTPEQIELCLGVYECGEDDQIFLHKDNTFINRLK